ncbi:MAG: caspase family protein [Flavobacteriales bacterium]
MKLLIKISLFLMLYQIQAQKTSIVVQAAHNGYVTKTFIDNKRDLLISFGSFTDKTLKYWNKKNGILIKTIDFQEFAKSVDFSEELGLTFLGYENRIDIYNNDTFKLVKSLPIKNFHKLVYRASTKELLYFSGEEPQNNLNGEVSNTGKITLNSLNVNTGISTKKSNVAYPSLGTPFYLRINKSGHHLSLYTSNTENYIYDIEQDNYFLMKDMPIEIFENDDLLYVFATDQTHVKVIRYNSYTKQIVWEKELVIEKIEKEGEIESSQIALSKNEKSFWLSPAKSTLIELDASSGDVLGVIYTYSKKRNIIADNQYVYALELASDKLFTNGYYTKYKKYNKKPVARFGYPIFNSNSFKPFKNKTKEGLVFSDLNGTIFSFSANAANSFLTKYETNFTQTYSLYGDIYVDKTANQAYYITNNQQEGIKTFKIGDKNSFKTKCKIDNESTNPTLNPDTKKIVQVFKNSVAIRDINTQQLIYKQQLDDVTNIVSNNVKFSPLDNSIAILINDEIQFEANYKMKLYFLDLNTKKIRWSKEKNYTHVFFIENGSQLLVFNKDTHKAEILDVKNGNKIRAFSIFNERFGDLAQLSPLKDKLITQVHERGLIVYDVKTGQILSQTSNFKENYYTNIKFITNQIYVHQEDNMFVFYDINNHKEIMRLYIFKDGEWIAHSPEGLFDGSQNTWERLVFVKGNETIPLDQIFNKFYTPRLFHKIVSGEKVEKPEVDIDQLKKEPTVTISYTEGIRNLTVEEDAKTIETKNSSSKITIHANGDRISEIQLFHNGKRVSLNTRNLTVEDDETSTNTKTFEIKLLEGENTFKAIALNSEKTESAPEILYVNYTKAQEIKNDVHGIQLHLLVIGINEYKNPKYNLNYAVADATAFSDKIIDGIGSITTKIETYIINNKDANRTKIVETLKQISKVAKPQDLFLFYYAGHGVVTQDAAKEFFLVPYDVTQLYGAVESLKQKGISANELKTIALKIPAQKQLYILDACQSAGALESVASRGVAEEKAIAQLARSTGTHWLTASGSDQYATEFDELGHGVFTYALLEALSGKADSGDNRITVNEIKAYLESRVPEISEQYKGSPQYPSSFGFGQDFPVSIIK